MEIQDSIQTILQSEKPVAAMFYEHYFQAHPEASHFFDDIDMERQIITLNMALLLIGQHYLNRSPTTEQYLKALGYTHAARRNVPPEAYGPFRDCLLDTLATFHGADWSESLAAQWRDALDSVIATMKQGYKAAQSA